MQKADSKILSTHQPVLGHVCHCTEPRMRGVMKELIAEHYGMEEEIDYDLACLAGGAGGFATLNRNNRANVLLDDIKEVGVEAHGAQKVVLLNHQDCGAYKKWAGMSFESGQEEAERMFHHCELRRAYLWLKHRLPGVEILLGYVHIVEDGGWDIEPVEY